MAWLPKLSVTCPMGLCNPTGALGNAALGYSDEIPAENLHLGLFSTGASLPSHHRAAFPVPQSTQKKLWPICSRGQGAQPASCTFPGGTKGFFFPSLQLLNTSKRGINTYRPSLFPSSVPSPCDYVSALLSLPAFHIRNSPHSPQRELQNWVS